MKKKTIVLIFIAIATVYLLEYLFVGSGLEDLKSLGIHLPENQIPCYINGEKVFATEDTCKTLSIQEHQQKEPSSIFVPTSSPNPPQVIYPQQKQNIVIPPVQVPEAPVRCTTRYFMGSPEVVCQHSWF